MQLVKSGKLPPRNEEIVVGCAGNNYLVRRAKFERLATGLSVEILQEVVSEFIRDMLADRAIHHSVMIDKIKRALTESGHDLNTNLRLVGLSPTSSHSTRSVASASFASVTLGPQPEKFTEVRLEEGKGNNSSSESMPA